VKKGVTEYFERPQDFNMFTGTRGNVMVDLGMKPSSLGEGKSIEKGSGSGDDKAESKGKKDNFVFFSDFGADTSKEKQKNKAKLDSAKAAESVQKAQEKLQKQITEMVNQKPEMKELLSSIKIEMTNEGLRIELIESAESLFFELGSSEVRPEAREILMKLAKEIGKLPNYVEIEGHTDSKQYAGKNFTNWDLSANRANASRRILESSGLWDGQTTKITGFADRKLRNPSNPFDISNRRVSILVKQLKAADFLGSK
jgi:chemotaxis protein MotB